MPVICYDSQEKEANGCRIAREMNDRPKRENPDMCTREGNIPHANRNEKPTTAIRPTPLFEDDACTRYDKEGY